MALKRWPGLIDVHVHLRDPGATHKEDFKTASRAAIKGGFSYLLDMPNNPIETVTAARVRQKVKLARKKALVEIGFHMGTRGDNEAELKKAGQLKAVYGLKVYLDQTTGGMMIGDLGVVEKVFAAWQADKPILVHAEGMQMAAALTLARVYQRRLHVCHVTRAEEVELLKKAKKAGCRVTAGTCPHYLFLTGKDREEKKGLAMMKPILGEKKDQLALWQGLKTGVLDLVESDHAPHTIKEKTAPQPAFGVPGLETTLGLMLLGVKQKKCSLAQVKKWLYDNPKRIFKIPEQKQTYIEFDPAKAYVLKKEALETKCGWSPFLEWKLYGKVEKAVIKGKVVLEADEFKG